MSLFRCEQMALYQLFLQSEASYNCVGQIGELGLVQFRDMNPDVNAFQRKFVGEVRRCEEMERKLRFIEKEVRKEDVKMPNSVDFKQVPHQREMVELENELDKLENELKELLSNQEQLQRNFLELTELKAVLTRTSGFLSEGGTNQFISSMQGQNATSTDIEHAAMDDTSGKLGVVAGVVKREVLGAFERVLWRVCRGNVYVKTADIEEPLIDPVSGETLRKTVFIVFFQGEQLGNRVKKICEGFRATLYPCPEQSGEREEMLKGVETRLQDLKQVLDQTLSHRSRLLNSAAANVPLWFVKARKIKSIYHSLNLFQVSPKYLQIQCWIPIEDIPKIQAALDIGTTEAGSSVASVLTQVPTKEEPPTFNKTNKFTEGFQTIIDAYGVASYREMNPMPFTVISFPFMFAVMFGDCGHGLIMALFALMLIWKEREIIEAKSKSEIFMMFFGGRYLIFLMGLFSIYTGLLYNDLFSKSINLFGTKWTIPNDVVLTDTSVDTIQLYPETAFKDSSPYPFGMDPIWQVTESKLDFLNSLKMKMSIILGVAHMLFGVIISLLNHAYFRKPVNVIGEFIPQFVFLGLLFGYLVFMIIFKWFAFDYTKSGDAPQLLITFTNMFMLSEPDNDLFSNQYNLQIAILMIGLICVPWMLFFKPIVLLVKHKTSSTPPKSSTKATPEYSFKTLNNQQEDNENEFDTNDDRSPLVISSEGTNTIPLDDDAPSSSSGGHGNEHGGDEEEFSFGQIMILQAIHTIEFCLGCISHTASYLRLWALSLAHAELSEVLWEQVFKYSFLTDDLTGVALIVPVFAFWACATVAILLLMEGLSAFLHALRLHWVEFQSKFYHGEGHLFTPFSYEHIYENPMED